MTLRIQCWSGPRNISTALMYSFRQRPDTTVIDEPLYAHYLHTTGRDHPLKDAVIVSQSTEVDHVIDHVILGSCPTPVLFIKQMAHHLEGVPREFLGQVENILLTRDPADMLPSLADHLPDCDLLDTGLPQQVELLDAIIAEGRSPLVIDSRALLLDPPAVLSAICRSFGLSFDEAMLNWPTGPKPEDGIWASEWYARAHDSTEFATYAPSATRLPDRLSPLLIAAIPLYERLLDHVVKF